MIKELANFFEHIAKRMGLIIKIPCPNRRIKKASILINGLVGIGFLISGMAFRKASLLLIGILGIAGAILLSFDD